MFSRAARRPEPIAIAKSSNDPRLIFSFGFDGSVTQRAFGG
jgi:hypothetical protein